MNNYSIPQTVNAAFSVGGLAVCVVDILMVGRNDLGTWERATARGPVSEEKA